MTQSDFFILVLGAVIAGLSLLLCRWLLPGQEKRIWANGLVIAALLYVGFALPGLVYAPLALEVAGLLIFALLAWGGGRRSLYFVALGWLLHLFWDAALHNPVATPFVPAWYPPICIGFDLVIALYLFWVAYAGDEAIKPGV